MGVQIFGNIALMIVINYWLWIPAVVVMIVVLSLRRKLLPRVQEIKRLELLGRSPIFSSIGNSVEGLVSIRAYSRENWFLAKFKSQTMDYFKVYYNNWLFLRFFIFVNDFSGSVFMACNAAILILIRDEISAETAGISFLMAI
jgi:ABC-type multidrug transport system fused ATPase/permease subunit